MEANLGVDTVKLVLRAAGEQVRTGSLKYWDAC
jgi:hypothetical protein